MKIIADENIPFGREAYGTLGDVTLLHGRLLSAAQVKDADLLFVRSITKVNAALLDGSKVKFVGTATAGFDHVDVDYLARRGIAFSAAPGCNANSVAEYMAAAWLTVAMKKKFSLQGLKVGIIGVGAVGSRVEIKARALGMIPVLNDPPKGRETGDPKYRPLDEVFDCDIITCHTPLTHDGPDPTHHLVNKEFFRRVKKGTFFCSAGRGEVVDEKALHAAMDAGRLSVVVLDVWENEPKIDPKLLARVDFGTPHIAGYSYDGKVNGTTMTYEAACRVLGISPRWDPRTVMAAPESPELAPDVSGKDDQTALHEIVTTIYPIERDNAALRKAAGMAPDDRGKYFDRLRKDYPYRREFHNTRLTLPPARESLRSAARGLGFIVP
ncbi:MAG: 4-phosphoerythronate dehydrogenase, partial [Candidatus Sumerlaeota bacterium]|nr:4-phosphoerythronate dehydrogenase [Candidatus Sumerlaeota bacterium]